LGGKVVNSVNQRIGFTVTLATLSVKRYTPRLGGSGDGTGKDEPPRADP